eukprot:scaffold68660_cov54-Phaeocystis_antarctica.AAC.6
MVAGSLTYDYRLVAGAAACGSRRRAACHDAGGARGGAAVGARAVAPAEAPEQPAVAGRRAAVEGEAVVEPDQ